MREITIISFFGTVILVPIIAIFFKDYCLKKYSIKNPNLSEENKEKFKINIKEKSNKLYKISILFSIFVIVLFFNYIKLFTLIPIFMVGFSIIFRALKKIKISNILCETVVIPFLVVIVIDVFNIIFMINYPILFSSIDSTSCNNSIREIEIKQFNSIFVQYEGEKNGSQVKTLIQDCLSSNIKEENIDRLISIYWDKDNSISYDDINNLPKNNTKPSATMSGYILGSKPEFNKSGGTEDGKNKEIDSCYTTPITMFIKNNNMYNVIMHYSSSGKNKSLVDCIIITESQE